MGCVGAGRQLTEQNDRAVVGIVHHCSGHIREPMHVIVLHHDPRSSEVSTASSGRLIGCSIALVTFCMASENPENPEKSIGRLERCIFGIFGGSRRRKYLDLLGDRDLVVQFSPRRLPGVSRTSSAEQAMNTVIFSPCGGSWPMMRVSSLSASSRWRWHQSAGSIVSVGQHRMGGRQPKAIARIWV